MKNNSRAYGALSAWYYDLTCGFASHDEAEFYASFCARSQGAILEPMSGSGRLLIPLVERGYIVQGLDMSSAMLERCRQRAVDRRLSVVVHGQSLETFELQDTYALMFIAVGSFQLLHNRAIARTALQRMREHLKIGGTLLIDIFIPESCDAGRVTRLARIDTTRSIRQTVRYMYDRDNACLHAYTVYELLEEGVVQRAEDEHMCVAYYTLDEFRALLEEVGFRVVAVHKKQFQDYDASYIFEAVK